MQTLKNFNLGAKKRRASRNEIDRYARIHYYKNLDNNKLIIAALRHEIESYYRAVKKIPCGAVCKIYNTADTNKVAIVAYDTPRKRLFARDNSFADFARKYGFVPKPVNVLAKYIKYGFVKSEKVEHLYHTTKTTWEICDDLETFRAAYDINFDEPDSICPDINGFSCMRQKKNVGDFYYHFGAKMLIFRDTDGKICGRAILWKSDGVWYCKKMYVQISAQTAAHEIRAKLDADGVIKYAPLPSGFYTTLCRPAGKSSIEIYKEIADTCQVPYLDEDVYLSDDKLSLNRNGYGMELQQTDCNTLAEYIDGYICESCGERLSEDDVISIDGYYYCRDCCYYCDDCNEYFRGDNFCIGDKIVCETCIENYIMCDCCGDYYDSDDCTYIEGESVHYCDDCRNDKCERCEDCDDWHLRDEMKEIEGEWYCESCADKKGGDDDDTTNN